MLFLLWGAVLVAAFVLFYLKTYSRFSSHGVRHLRVVPFFGNLTKTIFGFENVIVGLDKMYNAFPDERFIGRYEFMRPAVLVIDLDLVKRITIKDFEHFIDHRGFVDESVDPLFARNLISLKGQEWKDMRSTLSPAFTSSKIKLMVPFMEEVGEQMIRALKRRIEESDSGSIDVDVKDLTSRFANDVIASCAFGLKVDSHNDRKNQFFENGKSASTLSLQQIMLLLLMSICPALAKKLKLELVPTSIKNFFVDLVMRTMKDREDRQIVRSDMIHLLMEAKKGRLSHDEKSGVGNVQDTGFATVEESSVGKKTVDRVWSDNDLVAQAILFFIAGFETISTAMSFTLHELALHPDIQERLLQEIKEENAKNAGKLNFDSIQNMKYMDMVTSEALRLWPPVVVLDRVCVKDYNMGRPNSKATEDYIIRKGEVLGVPVWPFHRDPKFYPDPEKFDPERFSEGNKHQINPFTYMPFGVGPRNCIGSRFALCELKVLLYKILLHMEVSPSLKTCIPSRLACDSFNLRLHGGHWLKFKPRS